MFATILHFCSMKNCSSTETTNKLRLTANDINAQVLVKDLLVLIVAHKIGEIAPDTASVFKDGEALLLTTVLYYATLGYAMPSAVYDKLQSLVKEIFLDSSYASFCLLYPWLSVTEMDWKTFCRIAAHWADITQYEPALPSVQQALERIFVDEDDETKLMRFATAPLMAREKQRIEEKKRRRLENIKANFPRLIETIKETLGNEATDEELMDHVATDEYDDFVVGLTNKRALELDKRFFAETHALLPPNFCLVGSLQSEAAMVQDIFLEAQNNQRCVGSSARFFKKFIYINWKINPVKYDPDWHAHKFGSRPQDTTNPVVCWADEYFDNDVIQDQMSDPPNQDEIFS